MLQDIRNNFQGTFAKVIIIIICIPFVIFGVESIFSTGPESSAAEVNGEKISEQELSQAVVQYKRRLISQMGDQFDPSMLEDARLARPVLDNLVEQKLLVQQANEQGFAISTAQIQNQIRQIPSFQDDEGKFSQTLFNQALAVAGLNSTTFAQMYQTELLTNQYQGAWVNTAFATDAEVAVNAQFTHEIRDIRLIRLALADIRDAIQVTDEQVKAYYDANPQQFQSKERVKAEYLELKKDQFIKPVDEAEVRAAFEQELAEFEASETRTISHILLEVNDEQSKTQALEKMAEIQQSLGEGKAFAELAKTYSQDLGSKQTGGLLGPLNEEAFPIEFVEAAKVLAEGEVSEVVETDAGLHLIELTAINKVAMPTFESRKQALEKELSEAQAQPEYALAVEELKDISFNAADLQEPAQALSLTIKSTPAVERGGLAGDAVFSQAEVLTQLFSDELIKEKLNGAVVEISPEHAVVVRVAEHQPAALLAFDVVKAQAKTLLVDEKAKAELAEKAKTLLAKLEEGVSVEQLAKDNALTWEVELAAKRTSTKVPAPVLRKAFEVSVPQAAPAVVQVDLDASDIALVQVDNVQLGKASDIQAAEREGLKRFIATTEASAAMKTLMQRFKEDADIDINLK